MTGILENTFSRMMALLVLCFAVATFQPASASLQYAAPQISSQDKVPPNEIARSDDRGHCHSDCEIAGGDTHSPNQSHEVPSQAYVFYFVVSTVAHARPHTVPATMGLGLPAEDQAAAPSECSLFRPSATVVRIEHMKPPPPAMAGALRLVSHRPLLAGMTAMSAGTVPVSSGILPATTDNRQSHRHGSGQARAGTACDHLFNGASRAAGCASEGGLR
jgi:hypothetical protein